jgi:membrane fusion protein, multidrug efflux system
MNRNRKAGIFAIAPLAISMVLIGCGGGKDAAKAAEEAAKAGSVTSFAVNTTTATRGQIMDYLMLSGDVVAGSTVDAYSDVAGKVTRLFVSVGDRVQKDTPLAEVDPSRPGMNFLPAVVRAPILGTVVSLPAELGMTVSQAAPIARLSKTDALELRTYVAERFISKIRAGLRADLSLDAYPGLSFKATVKELDPVLDPSSRTMEIRLGIVGTDARLKAGMFAKIKVITEEKADVVKIPASALVRRFGEISVFTVESDPGDPKFLVARRRVVSAGILVDDVVEILSGLSGGDEIVVRGQSLLEDGSRINVVERLAPLSAAD